jgi:hypothetical protein
MRIAVALVLLTISAPALADGAIDIARGPDSVVYGSCVPSLVAENKSSDTIDYLQVDVLLTLSDGQTRTVELKSAYRDGVLYPLAPGSTMTLRQHLDTSRAIGVSCGDIKQRTVGQTICETRGTACTVPMSIRP